VILADDHRVVTDALARVLSAQPDIRIVGIAATVAEVRELAGTPVDVVLMDYRFPDGTGVQALRSIRSRSPGARIVMLTALDDDETILDSVQAGADGYITKDRNIEDVVNAVRDAHAGAMLLPASVIRMIASRVAAAHERSAEPSTVDPLTTRELQVLTALSEGLSTPGVCAQLGITPNTLRTHVQNIMAKLHVHSKLEAVAFALRHRLIEPPRAR
jgi:DNA-binding NarL/FixJ family response regulator